MRVVHLWVGGSAPQRTSTQQSHHRVAQSSLLKTSLGTPGHSRQALWVLGAPAVPPTPCGTLTLTPNPTLASPGSPFSPLNPFIPGRPWGEHGASGHCGLGWHLGPHQGVQPTPAWHHPSPQPSSSCPHQALLGCQPRPRLLCTLRQGHLPGPGQREGQRAAPCLQPPQETPGPYRPSGEADLSLVPRPSVRTLQRRGARCDISRHRLRVLR